MFRLITLFERLLSLLIVFLLLTVISCGSIPALLGLIQGIMMLCMTESDFKRKYIDSTSTLPLF